MIMITTLLLVTIYRRGQILSSSGDSNSSTLPHDGYNESITSYDLLKLLVWQVKDNKGTTRVNRNKPNQPQ